MKPLNLRQRLDGQHSFCRNGATMPTPKAGNADSPG